MTASTPKPFGTTPRERLRRRIRQRHDRLAPKLDCDGFGPAVMGDGGGGYCAGCGLVLFRGGGSGKEDSNEDL